MTLTYLTKGGLKIVRFVSNVNADSGYIQVAACSGRHDCQNGGCRDPDKASYRVDTELDTIAS